MRINVAGLMVAALLLFVTAGGAWGQEGPPKPGDPGTLLLGNSEFDPNQPIKPGFTLSINVSSAAGPEGDLSGTFTVDATGSIQMKLVGAVPVRDLTPPQAADKIAALLKPYIKDPVVRVAITAVPRPVILLGGAVLKSSAYPINTGSTLAEVLTVYGFNPGLADLSRVRVTRADAMGAKTTTEYNVLRWLRPAPGQPPDETQNPALQDKDFVFVPSTILPATGSIRVEGTVLKPGLVPIDVGLPLHLREVLARAGGPAPTADRRQVTVRRIGRERPFVLDYDLIEAGDSLHNIVMQTDDIVYVQTLGIDQFVNLNGAFIRPGKLPYTKSITLTQAISEAGGLLLNAKEKDGRIFRNIGATGDPTKTQIISFNYDRIRKNLDPDIRLEPSDTVEMPIGLGPRPQLSPLELTQSLLSIALIVDRLFSGGSSGRF